MRRILFIAAGLLATLPVAPSFAAQRIAASAFCFDPDADFARAVPSTHDVSRLLASAINPGAVVDVSYREATTSFPFDNPPGGQDQIDSR